MPLKDKRPRVLLPHPSLPHVMLVPLTQGHFALIDSADADVVGARCWSIKGSKISKVLYAQANVSKTNGKRGIVKLHRFLWRHWGMPDVPEIDHENTDGLDCRRSNLRAATKSQNMANQGRIRTNTSGAKGVSRHPDGKWQVKINSGGKQRHLGLFADKEAAVRAYAEAAARFHGEFARTE